ncbi:MAG: MFS transporter [Actinomycetota bacterium]
MTETIPTTETEGEPANALAVPSFRAFWFNGLTFFMASNSLRFVYGWVVLDGLGRGEAAQGFVVFILGLPAIFLLLPAGVWADRIDPKRMLLASQTFLLVVLAVTAVAMGDGAGTMTLLVVSAVIAGTASAIGGPVRQSLVPALLPPKLLFNGIAVNALAMTSSMVFGAVLAERFGTWFGFDGAFWWMVGLLILGIAALTLMQSPGPATTGEVTTMRRAIGEGMRFVWNERAIRTLFILLSISGFLMTPIMFVTIQAHVKAELGRPSSDAAPILALMGLGIALSSVFIMRRGNMADKGVKFMRAMVGGTTIMTLMGFTTAYWQMLTLGLLMGLCGGFFINMNQGLIQTHTPKEVMGRVMGLYALVQIGLTPFGAVLIGVLAESVGTGPAMAMAGGLALSLVLLIYATARSIRELA